MRNKNATFIPNELASAVKEGYVTSAELVKDYHYQESLEDINTRRYLDIHAPGEGLDDRMSAFEDIVKVTIDGQEYSIVNKPTDIQLGVGKLPTANAVAGITSYVDTNSDWIYVIVDIENRILGGVKKDGSIEWAYGVPTPVREWFTQQFNEFKEEIYGQFDEFKEEIRDAISFIDWIKHDKYIEATVDRAGQLLSYRKKDGTKVESILEVGGLNVYNKMKAISDWSNEELVILPIPKEGAIVNLIIPDKYSSTKYGMAYAKGLDWECKIEYYDKLGNYFKKPILLNAQGDSSLGFEINNQAFDLDDGSEIKFGNWIKQDSFHLKKYFQDIFRGQCIVAYKLIEQVYLSRPKETLRPWSRLAPTDIVFDGKGELKEDFDTGAMAHPDGFPVELFVNGETRGIYTFNLKKHRDNYLMKKTNDKHIILDGRLGTKVFGAEGNLANLGESNGILDFPNVISSFEIRNPKNLVYALELHNDLESSWEYDADFAQADIAGPDNYIDEEPYNYSEWESNPTYPYNIGDIVYLSEINNDGETIYHYFIFTGGENSLPSLDKNTDDKPKYSATWINCTTSVKVKNHIARMSKAMSVIDSFISNNDIAGAKEAIKEYFDVDFIIDYILTGQILYHHDGFWKNWLWATWDGKVWLPTLYDCDSVFGTNTQGTYVVDKSTTRILGTGNLPTKYMTNKYTIGYTEGWGESIQIVGPYFKEICKRYKELRDLEIFSVDNIMILLEDWLEQVGYDRLENECELFKDRIPSYRKNYFDTNNWKVIHKNPNEGFSTISNFAHKQEYEGGEYVTYHSSLNYFRCVKGFKEDAGEGHNGYSPRVHGADNIASFENNPIDKTNHWKLVMVDNENREIYVGNGEIMSIGEGGEYTTKEIPLNITINNDRDLIEYAESLGYHIESKNDGNNRLKNSINEYDSNKIYKPGDHVKFMGSGMFIFEAINTITNTPPVPTDKIRQYLPLIGGFYNSTHRVRNWLKERINTLDSYYNYA